MVAIRTALTRQMKALVAVLAAMVIAMTSLVIAAPSANAAYPWTCVVSKRIVHRGGQDAVFCRHGAKLHTGRAYAFTHHHHHRQYILLKKFRTGRHGNALFAFRIKPRLPLGRRKVYVRCGRQVAHFFIVVKRHR